MEEWCLMYHDAKHKLPCLLFLLSALSIRDFLLDQYHQEDQSTMRKNDDGYQIMSKEGHVSGQNLLLQEHQVILADHHVLISPRTKENHL
jgi:hypothetical protein